MSILANRPKNPKLADAALSLKAVMNYQRNRRTHGADRVRLYFDDVDGDWLNQFDKDEPSQPEECHLSKDLCGV